MWCEMSTVIVFISCDLRLMFHGLWNSYHWILNFKEFQFLCQQQQWSMYHKLLALVKYLMQEFGYVSDPYQLLIQLFEKPRLLFYITHLMKDKMKFLRRLILLMVLNLMIAGREMGKRQKIFTFQINPEHSNKKTTAKTKIPNSFCLCFFKIKI